MKEDKKKSQTYNFLVKNKSRRYISKRKFISKQKIRHGGIAFKWSKINNNKLPFTPTFFTMYEQKIIGGVQAKLNTPQELKKILSKREELEKFLQIHLDEPLQILEKEKQKYMDLEKYKYNIVTYFDEKKIKKTGIQKIHEEILPIEDKIFLITTLVHIDNSITEEIIDFQQLSTDFKVIVSHRWYKNIDEYKGNRVLCTNNSHRITKNVKELLKEHREFKLKLTKRDKIILSISVLVVITVLLVTNITATSTIGWISMLLAGLCFKKIDSLFAGIKEKSWSLITNKLGLNKEEKAKKECKAIVENLKSNKLETRLDTQFNILKQELNNRKNKSWNELFSKPKDHNSNIKSQNDKYFDSFMSEKINQEDEQYLKNLNDNWNKVKCILAK